MEHRFTSNKGIELIKKFEGFRSEAYVCPRGYQTIGYGHRLLPGEQYVNISIETADNILTKDLYITEKGIVQSVIVELNDNQFAALVSFTFNLGIGSFSSSTLRKKLNSRLYDEAKEEFLKWIYVNKTKSQGLINRRIAESQLFALPIQKNKTF